MPGSASRHALANLVPWAQAQDVPIDQKQREQLEIYLDNLLLWNRRISLVSQQDPVLIVEKHFADAILAAKHCSGGSTVADLGSGAGFPGMIIAIHCPAARVTLIESRGRKASFLVDTVRAVGLENVEVVAHRIETVARRPEHASQYEISIARALGDVGKLLEYSQLLLRSGGKAVAMKGPSYANEIETTPIQRLGFGAPAVHSYSLPDRSQRVLLTFDRL